MRVEVDARTSFHWNDSNAFLLHLSLPVSRSHLFFHFCYSIFIQKKTKCELRCRDGEEWELDERFERLNSSNAGWYSGTRKWISLCKRSHKLFYVRHTVRNSRMRWAPSSKCLDFECCLLLFSTRLVLFTIYLLRIYLCTFILTAHYTTCNWFCVCWS